MSDRMNFDVWYEHEKKSLYESLKQLKPDTDTRQKIVEVFIHKVMHKMMEYGIMKSNN